jgi:RHS repeat-associated protein
VFKGVTYTYDGDGKRVKKSSGTLYWYGMGADALDETDLTGSTTNSAFNEYVFFNGKRTARRNSSNAVFYYFADHLGTSRTIVQAGQTTPCYDADFYPFGGERTPVTNLCPQNYKFTGKERDSETGLDYFGARYYSNGLGRWFSADWSATPVPIPYADMSDPQSLNLYEYVIDRPQNLMLTDTVKLSV